MRYGVRVKRDVGENTVTAWLIDWSNPGNNDFGIAEEETVAGGEHSKRPDVVIYVNGIALGVLELKRSTVSVAEGIRQNLDNQKPIFIERFFTTMQLVMAGNDTEGMRYGTINTPALQSARYFNLPSSKLRRFLDFAPHPIYQRDRRKLSSLQSRRCPL